MDRSKIKNNKKKYRSIKVTGDMQEGGMVD